MRKPFNPFLSHLTPNANNGQIAEALAHAVTVHDRQQQSKKSYNPYALGIYLGAVHDFRPLADKIGAQAALRECFTQNPKTGKYDINEVEKVAKAAGISDAIDN